MQLFLAPRNALAIMGMELLVSVAGFVSEALVEVANTGTAAVNRPVTAALRTRDFT